MTDIRLLETVTLDGLEDIKANSNLGHVNKRFYYAERMDHRIFLIPEVKNKK